MYKFPISTQLSKVFNELYCHTNCFAWYNGEVIKNFSPLEDGSIVVVKEVSNVTIQVNGGMTKHIISIVNIEQTFRELFSNNARVQGVDFDYSYLWLRHGTEEKRISWNDLLCNWLWKNNTIELTTQINVNVMFKEENFITPYNLRDTVESVVHHEVGEIGSYFVFNDEGKVLSHSTTLLELSESGSLDLVCLIIKSALFMTNLGLNKVDLTKYRTMGRFMQSYHFCEVHYNNKHVKPEQTMSDFVYRSFHMDRCLQVVVDPDAIRTSHFSNIGVISQVAKNEPQKISKKVDKQCKIYWHWIAIAIYDHYTFPSNASDDDTVNTIADNIKKLVSTDVINDKILVNYEVNFTALICQQFQRCFDHEVLCLHQAVIRHPPNHAKPDLYFVSKDLTPLLVADFKSEDFGSAEIETFGYCMAIFNVISSKPVIAMPCTKKKIIMYICFSQTSPFSSESSLLPIKICEINPKDGNEMREFIKLLISAIYYRDFQVPW